VRIAPGGTIGIIGGGQLGRMLAIAAAQLGYRCHIYDPHARPIAADVAAAFTRGDFADAAALDQFAAAVDVITYEFENLPVAPLAGIAFKLRPSARSLATAQDRAEEKRFIESCGARVAPWRPVDSLADLDLAVAALGLPLVLKSRRYGYDGKGQAWVRAAGDAAAAWAEIGEQPAVAEAGIAFDAEFSVILARGIDGRTAVFDSADNHHREGILRRSTVSAGESIRVHLAEARRVTAAIADRLDHHGVLTAEFFATPGGPLVNEIAPRVHNSGHWSIEAAHCSQFEQHIRAICGLPLGDPALRVAGATMDNLIGDDVLTWEALAADPAAALHLYGKGQPRPGRKMGHVTRVSATA
jgi:5-(carboxyamino)imidazole ribonucleotide synthase